MITLPKKHKAVLYINANTSAFMSDSDRISISDFDMSNISGSGCILLGTVEHEFDIPQIDLINAQVEMLKESKEKLRAKAEMEIQRIDDQINSLLSIEHKN